MPLPRTFLKGMRLLHLYLGVFFAPALLFFAFTGAVQTFSLHETTRGSNYQPPQVLVTLAQIHKKQTPVVPVRKPAPDAPGPRQGSASSMPPGASGATPGNPPQATRRCRPRPPVPHRAYPPRTILSL